MSTRLRKRIKRSMNFEQVLLNTVRKRVDCELGRRRSTKTGVMLRLIYNGKHKCFIYGSEPNLDPNFSYLSRSRDTRDVTITYQKSHETVEEWVEEVHSAWKDFVSLHDTSKSGETLYLRSLIFSKLESTYLAKKDTEYEISNRQDTLLSTAPRSDLRHSLRFTASGDLFEIIKSDGDDEYAIYKRKLRCYEDYVQVLTEIGFEIQTYAVSNQEDYNELN